MKSLNLFRKTKPVEEINPLEEKLTRFIDRARSLKDFDPSLGFRYLRQAHRLYDKIGYKFEIEREINEVVFLYMKS